MLDHPLQKCNCVTGLERRSVYKAGMSSEQTTNSAGSGHRLSVFSAAIGCAVAIAACGSTGPVSGQASTNASNAALLVKYSACMRAHGVPDFPDPSTTETPNSFGMDGYNFDLPANLNPQSPAYQSANKTCQPRQGGGGGLPHDFLAKARRAALAHAVCMRNHGVPNYPDPIVTGSGGGVTVGQSAGSGLSPRSPAFQQAQKACQHG
jgi:hypothetical protein